MPYEYDYNTAVKKNAFFSDIRRDISRCMEAGMNDHVSKPIVPGKLLAALEGVNVCGRARISGRNKITVDNTVYEMIY